MSRVALLAWWRARSAIRLVFTWLIVAPLVACGSDQRRATAAPIEGIVRPDAGHADGSAAIAAAIEIPLSHVGQTNGGTYQVSWRSMPEPIPENEPFQLLVQVDRVDGSGPVAEDLVVEAGAWMPAHQHSMVRQPQTTPLGDGRFSIDGMLLHMGGEWTLNFDVIHDRKIERAKFSIGLIPPSAMAGLDCFDPEEIGRMLALSPLPPAPDDPTNAYDTSEAAARLGQYLFFERRLSSAGDVSCASCHVPELDWTDGKPLADVGTPLERHTPSLWNVAYGRWFFWDGRADSLWGQALHPLEEPREHAGDRVSIARLLWQDAGLRRGYTEVFGQPPDLSDSRRFPPRAKPMTNAPDDPLAVAWSAMSAADQDAINRVFANVGKALAAFERRIVSRSAPFDAFVEGLRTSDPVLIDAISPAARRGLKLFIGKANCHFCHSGPNFTDREFHNNRVPLRADLALDRGRSRGLVTVLKDPFNGLGTFSDGEDLDVRDKLKGTVPSDEGRAEFKTPTLRNVGKTAPYMHQGQIATLEQVVDFYSDEIPPRSFHQEGEVVLVPLHLTAEEKSDLLAFLESLTESDLLAELLRPPPTPYLDR